MDIDEMRDQIVRDFSKEWERNDSGHRIGHFAQVEECGQYINQRLGLGFDPKLIMMVAYFHDLFSWDRDEHHTRSAHWVDTCDYPLIAELRPHEREMVVAGCREHRASGDGKFSCDFAQLMASADRGFPVTDPEPMVQRAIKYRLARGWSLEDARVGAIEHVKEKFGSTGYAQYPDFYLRTFGPELEQQRKAVDAL